MGSLITRLTLRYTAATIVIVLVMTLGIAVSQTIAFDKEVKATLSVARHDAVALMTSQLHAGRPLREAAIYTSEHLGRPRFAVLAYSDPDMSQVFSGYVFSHSALSRDAGFLLADVTVSMLGISNFSLMKARVPGGILLVQPDYARLAEEIAAMCLRLLPFVFVATGIAYILARNIAGHALRPLRDVTQALHEFAQGDFTPIRIPANAAPEVGAVNGAYNAAAAQAQKAVDDRELAVDNVRTFIADASHELKTPLTIIMGYVGAIVEGVVSDRDDEKRILTKTLAECRRMRGTIEKLISLARLDREPVNAETVDIVALTRDVTESMKPLSPQLRTQVTADGDAVTLGNAGELREALVCIIENAVKYAPGSPIDVQVTKAADLAVVEIADAGPGMSAEDRERAFERFRRGSSHGDVEGSGLGLAIAKRAVERANGRIALSSELGRGTTVRLYLPCVAVRTS